MEAPLFRKVRVVWNDRLGRQTLGIAVVVGFGILDLGQRLILQDALFYGLALGESDVLDVDDAEATDAFVGKLGMHPLSGLGGHCSLEFDE